MITPCPGILEAAFPATQEEQKALHLDENPAFHSQSAF
jgi:hypothetical protein